MAHGQISSEVDGAKLKQLREDKGWSLRVLEAKCRKAGHEISNSQLSKYENEKCRPRPALLVFLAKTYRTSVKNLRKPASDLHKPAEEVKAA